MSSSKANSSSSSSSSSSSKDAGTRPPLATRVDQPSDLLVTVKYHNSLPYPPCGLFMKPIVHRDLSEYAECVPSSLEKNLFVWAPHMPNDIGLDVDLVDQAKFSFIEYPNKLTILDDKILSNSNAKKDKKESNVDNTWFLRAHLQFNNNIMRKNAKAANNKNNNTNNKYASNQDFNPFAIEFVEDSFVKVEKMQKVLEDSRKKDGAKIEAVYDIFPDFGDNPSYIAKFDNDPFPDARTGKNVAGLKRMVESLLYNVRAHKDEEKGMDKFISLVAAKQDGDDEKKDDIDDVFGADDDDDDDNGDGDASPRSKKMKLLWVQDYVMSIKPLSGNDETLVLKMHKDNKTSAQYQNILSRLDLSDIIKGEEVPINVTVTRRDH